MAFAKYDKAKAIFLRRLGWKYKMISEFLGCSVVWCKQNLADVEVDKNLMFDFVSKYFHYIKYRADTEEYIVDDFIEAIHRELYVRGDYDE